MNFSSKRSAEVVLLSVDFANVLAPTGASIATAVWSNSVYSGIDLTPAAMLRGASSITGTRSSQYVGDGLPNVVYMPICMIKTTDIPPQVFILPESGQGMLLVNA